MKYRIYFDITILTAIQETFGSPQNPNLLTLFCAIS